MRLSYLNSGLLHGIFLLLVLVMMMRRIRASGGIVRPRLVAIDEILVCDLIKRFAIAIVGLEEETRELVSGEIIQSSQHNLVIELSLSHCKTVSKVEKMSDKKARGEGGGV
jgi:hypothetical protein